MYTFSAFASIFHPAAWDTDKVADVPATVLDHEMTLRVKIKSVHSEVWLPGFKSLLTV